MAIYSLKLGFISRSDGKSSVGFSAYISGSKSVDKRIGQSFNFSHKQEVKTARILTPENSPSWVYDRRVLWNQVEAFEDHIANLRFQGGDKSQAAKEKFIASAQTAQTVMGALPVEFTLEQAEACVEEFLKSRFVSRGLVVDYAIHDDKGNPHFHALVTRRALDKDTFSLRKDREIVSREQHNLTRKAWEQVANKHLEKAGLDLRIDSRSKQDQGSLLLATHHEGWYAQQLADQGKHSRIIAENEEIRQRNIEIIVEKPESIIHEVALKRTTFTSKHIEEEIIRRVGGDEKLYALLKSKLSDLEINSDMVLSSSNDNVVYDAEEMRQLAKAFTEKVLKQKGVVSKVGENMDRETVYTSKDYREKEKLILGYSDALNGRTRKVDSSIVERAIQRREVELKSKLSVEQRQAIHHLCSGSDIRVLNGKAGTGKTTLLKAVAESYQESGYTVMGTSFQGKAVEIMQKEIGIPCRTLDSFIHHWKKQSGYQEKVDSGKLWGRPYLYAFQKMKDLESYRFTDKHVLIVDEANMIAGKLWAPFLKEASDKGAKVIVVQDPAQIKSREPGDVGRLLSYRYGFAETNTVVRQRVDWQKECSQHFNEHQILDGLKPYHDQGHIHWSESKKQAIENLSKAYVKGYEVSSDQMALAFTNEEVRDLNQSIRSKLMEQGRLTKHNELNGEQYSIGDRIRFKENDNYGMHIRTVPESLKERFISDRPKGTKNGTLGFIESIEKTKITVLLEDNRRVRFCARDYKDFTHGYAMTVHKSEGSTFDRAYVMPSRYMDPETTLVSMTRHRDGVEVFTDRDTFVDLKDMVDTLSQGHFHETLQDYKVSNDQKPYLERIRLYRDLANEAVTLREEMEGDLDGETPLYRHGSYKAYQLCYQEKKEVAGLILKDWESHKPFTRLAGIRKDVLEVETGVRSRFLSDVEQRASIQVETYKDVVRTTKTLWQHIQATHPSSLAQDHQLYEDYEARKAERDSIASEFVKSPKLYQQFFRDDDGQGRIYWAAVKSHAQAHEVRISEEVYVKGLRPEQKESYDLLKSYIDTRNKSAVLYSEVRKESEASVQIQNPDRLLRFKDMQLQRDELALQVVLNMETCGEHFERFEFKEDALLAQAVNAEVRGYAKDYYNVPHKLDRCLREI